MPPWFRRGAAALAVTATAVLAVAVLEAPARAASTPRTFSAPRTAAAVVPGVRVWHENFRLGHRRETSDWLYVDLSTRKLSVNAVAARGVTNGSYESVPDMATRTGAVAGVNGDFFHLGTRTGSATGGTVSGGRIYKTPRPRHQANLFVTSKGRAGIGPAPYVGRVTNDRRAARTVYSVNSPEDVPYGSIVLFTPVVAGPVRMPGCTAAYLQRKGTATIVAHVDSRVRQLQPLTADQSALVACASGGAWLKANLLRGHKATVSVAFTGGPLQTLISGGRILLRDGKRYTDPTAHRVSGRNAETFACVDTSGTKLLLGVVDSGWYSSGISNADLATLLLGKGCRSAIVFDGGGSTTLVTRARGSRPVVRNAPADGAPRRVPNGLFVFAG